MKNAVIIVALMALAACTGNPPKDQPHPRVEPSNYTPGIHVTGSATVGVARTF